ncbi:MAG: YraN family protein, partial [Muribaculaceae bacterium]|nr:YraN family protein [Muribaculaceae bacterium]
MAQHNDIGKWGEEVAANYLRKKGYTVRDTNWRCV